MSSYEKKELNSIRNNIWKLYAVAAVSDALFFIPVIIPFFKENGLSLKEIFLVQGIYALTMMVLEIPSGYLSDSWGRKKTMLAGSIVGLVGMFVYAFSSNLWSFIVGEILLAIQFSFHSGTRDAITYDTLLELDEEPDYRRIIGQQQFYRFLAAAVASVVGGLLAVVTLRATMIITIIPFVLSFVFVLLLQEPKRHKLQETRHLQAIWDITINTLIKNIPLRSVILLSAIMASLTGLLMWLTQPYQSMIDLPLMLFGVTHAAMMISAGLASKSVYLLEERVDDRFLLMALATVIVISYLLLGFTSSLWGITLLFLGRTMWGFLTPLTSNMINRMTSSEIRATVLSTQSFVRSLLFGITLPLVGCIADVLSLNQAMLFIGIAGGLILVVIFIRMIPVWKQVPK